jgi:hypothetical protein
MYGTKMGYVRKDFGNVFKQRCFNKYNGITNVSIEKYQCQPRKASDIIYVKVIKSQNLMIKDFH